MSVYRSAYVLTKLFGIAQADSHLLNDESKQSSYPTHSHLKQDVTPIGYSTRLQFTDLVRPKHTAKAQDNLETTLSSHLYEINTFILQLIDSKENASSKLPIVITHNFVKGEIDISANSPHITSILEAAFSCNHGEHYRELAWKTFQLLKSSSSDDAAIYLLNGQDTSVMALTNSSALQLHIEAKPGNLR